MIFMGLILKIPVAAACWLIWHAVRSEPEPASSSDSGDGNQPHRDFRREPRHPRGPRRGPHAPGAAPLPCPKGEGRVRVMRRPAVARTAGSAATHRR
jgi:hypothetical protein